MPVECDLLDKKPPPVMYCYYCGAEPFIPFMRGMVQRSKRKWFIGKRHDYCAIICSHCKQIIGWESP